MVLERKKCVAVMYSLLLLIEGTLLGYATWWSRFYSQSTIAAGSLNLSKGDRYTQ